MDKVVIASMRKGAGKTSSIVGIAGASNRKMSALWLDFENSASI